MRFLGDGWPSRTAVMEHAPILLTVKAGRIIHAQLFESLPISGKGPLAIYRTGEYFSCEGSDDREPWVVWTARRSPYERAIALSSEKQA